MTEVIAMIAVGIGISGLILNGQRNIREEMRNSEARLRKDMENSEARLRKEMQNSEARLREEMQDFKAQVDARFEQVDSRFEKVEGRLEKIEGRVGVLGLQQAKLEGLLEGLREAISGRAMAQHKDEKKA